MGERAASGARLALVLMALAGAPASLAQGGAPGAAAATAPNRGLQEIDLTLRTGDGRAHRYRVEVARTPEQQERGMMFRRSMPRGRGMLFPTSPPRQASFWMRNTLIPLDIIFIAPDNRVLSIGSGEPLSERFVESGGVVGAVLELNAGEAARIGLRPGDRAEW